MEFPSNPVSLSDCQLNWESLKKLFDGSNASGLISTPGKTGIRVAIGAGTWTWPGGSPISNGLTLTHGLGRIPIFAGAFAGPDQGATEMITGSATNLSSTTLLSRGAFRTTSPGAGVTSSFYWVAIG